MLLTEVHRIMWHTVHPYSIVIALFLISLRIEKDYI